MSNELIITTCFPSVSMKKVVLTIQERSKKIMFPIPLIKVGHSAILQIDCCNALLVDDFDIIITVLLLLYSD